MAGMTKGREGGARRGNATTSQHDERTRGRCNERTTRDDDATTSWCKETTRGRHDETTRRQDNERAARQEATQQPASVMRGQVVQKTIIIIITSRHVWWSNKEPS
jgi:hypothetical protein